MSQAASPSPDLPGDPAPIIGEPPRLIRKIDKWRFRPWFRHGEFSTDWATSHFSVWRKVLAPLRGRGINVLEIGSWEGRSAIFFLNYLRDCRIVCIDTFAGGVEHQTAGPFVAEVPLIEQRFDRNLAHSRAASRRSGVRPSRRCSGSRPSGGSSISPTSTAATCATT